MTSVAISVQAAKWFELEKAVPVAIKRLDGSGA